MMKRYFLFIVAMVCTLAVCADPVTKSNARQIAQQFLQRKGKSVKAEPVRAPRLQRGNVVTDDAAYYVFNSQDGQGFVIVSGDDRTTPVLGYADNGSFVESEMPENVKAWLQGYADQIACLGDAPRKNTSHVYHEAVPVILKTEWGQGEPYNNACHVFDYGDDQELSVTGCVATALAQVMYHYKYPTEVKAAIPAYEYSLINHPEYPQSVAELPVTTFDWDNMKTDYTLPYTEAEAAAVAELMSYCGRSVKMMYSPGSSGADDVTIPNALITYFGYDKSVKVLDRDSYTAYEWQEIIYGELSAGRPVIYGGATDEDSGHEFVCDGYNGEGKYHINWGWNGRFNGYYALTVLDPDPTHSQTGSGSGTTGYIFRQSIVVNVKPDEGGSIPEDLYLSAHQLDSGDYFSVGATTITGSVWNSTGHTANFMAGCQFIPESGDPFEVYASNFGTLSPQYGSAAATLVNLNWGSDRFPDGTYKIIPISGSYSDTSNPNVTNAKPLVPGVYIEAEISNLQFVSSQIKTDAENESLVDTPEDDDPILGPYPEDIDGTHLYCTALGVNGDIANWTSVNMSESQSYTAAMGLLNDDGTVTLLTSGFTKDTPYAYKENVNMSIDLGIFPSGRTYKLVPISKIVGTDDWKNDVTDGSYIFYDPVNGIIEIRKDVTAISIITNTAVETEGNYYTIDGMHLVGKPSKKGIYIHNGKKVVM